MKKILIALILFAGVNFAQTDGVILTNKLSTYSDSLQYKTDAIAGKDSVWIIKVHPFEFARFIVKGNANNPVDSLAVKLGGIRYNKSGTPIDTLWGSDVAVKDSAWNTVNRLINNSVGKDYSLYTMPVFQLMKIAIKNHRGTLPTRKVDVIVELK